jgi:hypothetical protein
MSQDVEHSVSNQLETDPGCSLHEGLSSERVRNCDCAPDTGSKGPGVLSAFGMLWVILNQVAVHSQSPHSDLSEP